MQHRESATKRTYAQLKAAILDGEFPVGRLDIQGLADRLRVSLTPVREALARLAAERLIDVSSRGFSIAAPSAEVLRDLYGWSRRLLSLSLDDVREPVALDASAFERLPSPTASETEGARYARDVCTLFYEIGMSQPSREIAGQLAQANDRLFRPRVCEPLLFPGAGEELSELTALWRNAELTRLRDKVGAYHRARIAGATQIAAELARRTTTHACP